MPGCRQYWKWDTKIKRKSERNELIDVCRVRGRSPTLSTVKLKAVGFRRIACGFSGICEFKSVHGAREDIFHFKVFKILKLSLFFEGF